jgi:hypothetical protein
MDNEVRFFTCAHCGRSENEFQHKVTSSAHHQISCPCGVITKLCQTIQDLQKIWNSRPKQPFEIPEISVKHAPPRGTEAEQKPRSIQGIGEVKEAF